MAMTAKRSREAPITFPHSSSFFCPMSCPQQDGGPHRKACEDIGNGLHDLGAGGDAGDIRRIAELSHHHQVHGAVHGLQKQSKQHREHKQKKQLQNSPLCEISGL